MIEKIEEILNKYKTENWCKDTISNISNNTEKTINQLKNVQNNLSHKLLDLNLSDQLEDDETISSLQKDIKLVKELILCFAKFKNNISDMVEYGETINDISVNVIPDDKFLVDNQLIFKDVIVLSNLISCTIKEHSLKDMFVKVPIFNVNGNINFVNINISYCNQCKKYIMLKNDFKQIEGVVACQVIDQTTTKNKSDIDDIELKEKESILYQYGYNVRTKDNLSSKQRHLILASVVESNILTREQICSHLDTLIERGEKIDNWKLATQKWKQDRYYIKKYNTNNLPNILLDKIILKYSQLSFL